MSPPQEESAAPSTTQQQEAFAKQRLRERALHAIKKDSGIPAFSPSAQKLLEVSSRENVTMDEIARVVQLDPGLTSKYLRLANAAYAGGKSVQTIKEALLRTSVEEVRKLASALTVMSGKGCFRKAELVITLNMYAKINWKIFWVHSLFVARLTDILANAYRPSSGKEHLAGLLHDVGKIFLESRFPQDFEAATLRAIDRGQGLYEAEKQMFDVNHAEVSWGLAEKWNLHREICRGIRFHHEPLSPFNKDPVDPEFEQFLASCICLSDALANACGANIVGIKKMETVDFGSLPEWNLLQPYSPREPLELNPSEELEKVQETIASLDTEVTPLPNQ